jgi:2-oxoglutarate/2-oxoacid ferredoxin oxidoreductase subunit beta
MSEPKLPKCVKKESKPSNFCPGCGHSMILKTLGFALDDMKLASKSVFVTDIGCSLLSWDYFDVDTFQSHHGRAAVTATGVKRALPKSTVIAYMGDGGGYAIGLHHLIHVAKRNEPMTVILVNNTVFAMTGGQMAPTTIPGEETETTPGGQFIEEEPFFGPELLRSVIKPGAFVARGSVDNLPQLKKYIEQGLENQNKNGNFSFIEVLSWCPVNWKKDAKGCISYLEKLKKIYPPGVFSDGS